MVNPALKVKKQNKSIAQTKQMFCKGMLFVEHLAGLFAVKTVI